MMRTRLRIYMHVLEETKSDINRERIAYSDIQKHSFIIVTFIIIVRMV